MRKANEDIWGIYPLFRVNLAYLRERAWTRTAGPGVRLRKPAPKGRDRQKKVQALGVIAGADGRFHLAPNRYRA
jgi:hypothetical protein